MIKYIKDKFKNIDPYAVSEIKNGIYMNANEAFYDTPIEIREHMAEYIKKNTFNRYPDADAKRLVRAISKRYVIDEDSITCGVGSDELIDIILRSSAENKKVVTISPSFSMYSVFTFMNEGIMIPVSLDDDFNLNLSKMLDVIKKERPIVTFICNPNNPTGTAIEIKDLEEIAKLDQGILVIDEAYEDFANNSAIGLLKKYNNICILKTFSKASALAAIRVGYALSSPDIIDLINTVKPPYTLNTISIEMASYAMENYHLYDDLIKKTIENREYLYNEIKDLGVEVYPSKANFLLTKVSDKVRNAMVNNNIFLRILGDHTRVSIGSDAENEKFLQVLKENL